MTADSFSRSWSLSRSWSPPRLSFHFKKSWRQVVCDCANCQQISLSPLRIMCTSSSSFLRKQHPSARCCLEGQTYLLFSGLGPMICMALVPNPENTIISKPVGPAESARFLHSLPMESFPSFSTSEQHDGWSTFDGYFGADLH
jgi:hypothetical protein